MTTETQKPVETQPVKHRQTVKGIVVSDKMTKTRVIELKRTQKHRLYHKGTVRHTKLFVHDEKNESKVGDVIIAESTRRLSRHKNYRLIEIVKKKDVE